MSVLTENLNRSTIPEIGDTMDLDRTYSVLSYGGRSGPVEDYTLIPVDQEGLVVVKNLVWFE